MSATDMYVWAKAPANVTYALLSSATQRKLRGDTSRRQGSRLLYKSFAFHYSLIIPKLNPVFPSIQQISLNKPTRNRRKVKRAQIKFQSAPLQEELLESILILSLFPRYVPQMLLSLIFYA